MAVPAIPDVALDISLDCSGCTFGVGLSWGSVCFETDHIVCPELIEI